MSKCIVVLKDIGLTSEAKQEFSYAMYVSLDDSIKRLCDKNGRACTSMFKMAFGENLEDAIKNMVKYMRNYVESNIVKNPNYSLFQIQIGYTELDQNSCAYFPSNTMMKYINLGDSKY